MLFAATRQEPPSCTVCAFSLEGSSLAFCGRSNRPNAHARCGARAYLLNHDLPQSIPASWPRSLRRCLPFPPSLSLLAAY
eukprot:6205940-Pleurochrysis_carterae.AAC.2